MAPQNSPACGREGCAHPEAHHDEDVGCLIEGCDCESFVQPAQELDENE